MIEEEDDLPDFLEPPADDVEEDENYAEIVILDGDDRELDPESPEVERYK